MKTTFMISTFLLLSNFCLAGTISSGGGGAFVCRDTSGTIQSSHLLDLWEAKEVWHLPIVLSNDPVETQLDKALKKLKLADEKLGEKTAEYIKILFLNAHILGDDVTLPAPVDADSRYQKKGCVLEGMMYYDGNFDQLQISPSVYDKLATNTDIAAAKMHEAVYYVIRNNLIAHTEMGQDQTSTPIRKLVGCLFSSDSNCLSPVLTKEQIIEKSESVYFCENSDLSYYMVKNSSEIQASMPSSCTLYGWNGNVEDWIGLFDRVNDHSFLVPTFFVKLLSSDELPPMATCSVLSRFNFSTGMHVWRKKDDVIDGHPLLESFMSRVENAPQYYYGTPVCRKMK